MGRVYQRTFLINVDFLAKVSKRHTLGLGPRPCLLLDGRAWLGSSIAVWSQQTRRLLSGGLILIAPRYRAGSGSISCLGALPFASLHLLPPTFPQLLVSAGRKACLPWWMCADDEAARIVQPLNCNNCAALEGWMTGDWKGIDCRASKWDPEGPLQISLHKIQLAVTLLCDMFVHLFWVLVFLYFFFQTGSHM